MLDIPEHIDPDLREILGNALPASTTPIAEVQKAIKEATIVFGFDTVTRQPTIFCGRKILNDIAKGRDSEWDAQTIVAFSYDSRTDELEFLLAVVLQIKGEHDYHAE